MEKKGKKEPQKRIIEGDRKSWLRREEVYDANRILLWDLHTRMYRRMRHVGETGFCPPLPHEIL